MQTAAGRTITEAEYLALDERSAERFEYFGGEVVLMAGAEPDHGAVVAGLVAALGQRLRGRPCLVWAESQRIRVDETGLYAYPDVVVTCGTPRFADTPPRTLLNPLVVIEVLSPSTESVDRGAKFAHYQRRASLKEYVLVSPDTRRVEHYARMEDRRWILTVRTDDELLELPALDAGIPLAEIYEQAELLAALEASSAEGGEPT